MSDEFKSTKDKIADPAFANNVVKLPTVPFSDNSPDKDTPLGWLPDNFVKRWITVNADAYRLVAWQDFDNGRTVNLLLHKDAKVDIGTVEGQVVEHSFKKPGQYFYRLQGERLVDVPVFIVFLTKNRTSPPKIGA